VYLFIATDVSGRGQTPVAVLQMHGASVINGEWWRLLTSAFLHVRLAHLISNTVLLCILGWMAEPLLGHANLLMLWVTSSVGSSIAQLLFTQPQSTSFGASGVVYGLVGALLYFYLTKQDIHTLRSQHIRMLLLALFVGVNFLGEWYAFRRPIPGHVGGLFAGVLFAVFLKITHQAPD
jgi:rhomboid protease GluP